MAGVTSTSSSQPNDSQLLHPTSSTSRRPSFSRKLSPNRDANSMATSGAPSGHGLLKSHLGHKRTKSAGNYCPKDLSLYTKTGLYAHKRGASIGSHPSHANQPSAQDYADLSCLYGYPVLGASNLRLSRKRLTTSETNVARRHSHHVHDFHASDQPKDNRDGQSSALVSANLGSLGLGNLETQTKANNHIAKRDPGEWRAKSFGSLGRSYFVNVP